MSSNTFAITSTKQQVALDSEGKGSIVFSVFNNSGYAIIPAKARVIAEQGQAKQWVTLADTTDKNFSEGATHQYTVNVDVPLGEPEGQYSFHLLMTSEENPDEDFTKSATIHFEVVKETKPEPVIATKFPWLWVILGSIGFLAIGALLFYFLFPSKIQLKNYEGKILDDIRKNIEDKGFVVDEQLEYSVAKIGEILNQDKSAGEYEKNTKVTFTVSQGVKKATLINTKGLKHNDALEKLRNLGFKKINIKFVASNSVDKHVVIKQTPSSGDYDIGKSIVLTLSEGLEIIKIEKLIGLNQKIAINKLENLGFKVSIRNLFHNTVPKNIVISQSPKGGNYYPKGSNIELSISKGKSQICFNSIQGKIAWNYTNKKTWSKNNINNLCKGAENSKESGICFKRVMHSGVNWGGGTKWKWINALNLCKGSQDADKTIRCFKKEIKQERSWKEATQTCGKK